MYVKYLSSCNTTSCLSTWRNVFLYWHCRVSEIYSVNHWDDEFTTIDTIKTWLTLKTFQKVQVFLKFVNFYRCFIKAYLQMQAHLQSIEGSKNEKTEPFEWSKDAAKTFVYLKKVFMTALILVHFDSELKNWMKTDAFRTHSDRNLLSVADVRTVTPCCLLIVKAVLSRRKLWDTWSWAFSHCWGI
jgi:hypothetical protein